MCFRLFGGPTTALPVLVESCVSWLWVKLQQQASLGCSSPETIHLNQFSKQLAAQEDHTGSEDTHMPSALLGELDDDALGIF